MADPIKLQPVTRSSNHYVNTLLYTTSFRPGVTITYVLEAAPGDLTGLGGARWAANGMRTAFNNALATWSNVANIFFQEVTTAYDGSQSRTNIDWVEQFEPLSAGIYGEHTLPTSGAMSGTFNSQFSASGNLYINANMQPGGIAFTTFVHETGHALGLLHPHPEGTRAGFPGTTSSSSLGSNNLNQGIYTVMTYNDGYIEVGQWQDSFGAEIGPGAFDIAAVQHLYGANTSYNTGANSYALFTTNAPGTGWGAIWDAGGNDTFSAANTVLDAIIDLRAATLRNEPGGGGFASRVTGVLGGYTIANGVVIENALGGGGDDRLHGNSADNRLDGGAGFDTVDYSGVLANVVVNLTTQTATGDGTDTLVSIENAIGAVGDDVLTAIATGISITNGAQDVVKLSSQTISSTSLALNLDGRFSVHSNDPTISAAATPTVTVHAQGGGSVDYYRFSMTGTGTITIDIDNSFGIDTIVRIYNASGTQLGSNDDNATEFDVGSASAYDSFLQYNNTDTGSNVFYVSVERFSSTAQPGVQAGSSYSLNISAAGTVQASGTLLLGSTLNGGDGNDTLFGGAGVDTFIGGNHFDTVNFASSATSVDANLLTGQVISGGVTEALISIEGIIGTAADDILTGNADGNRFDGGVGADRMTGGGGSDIYIVNTQADLVFEDAGGGTADQIQSTVSFYLYANVEELALIGSANIFGVGNEQNNYLYGNSGENLLIAGAGDDYIAGDAARDALFGEAGNDRLFGGLGVDYIVGGDGADAIDGGEDADEIYGEQGRDTIYGGLTFDTDIMVGGEGDDTIYGNSGLGDYDPMYGQEGWDVYYVDTPADLVFEQLNEGYDTVYADIVGAGYYLYDNIEALVLVGETPFGVGNALNNAITGNDGDNYLLGGDGDDVLQGMGGNDVLFGQAGADQFDIIGGGTDTVGDFERGVDRINITFWQGSFADLQKLFIQVGNVGAIQFATGEVLILHNVTMSQLTAADFGMGGP